VCRRRNRAFARCAAEAVVAMLLLLSRVRIRRGD
jgi:hypothetical protein